jgi:hypothetical protein
MDSITNSPSFINWRDGQFFQEKFNLGYVDDNFKWKETFMIGEVPKDDQWPVYSTGRKLALETLYENANVHKECTRHYMNITPTVEGPLAEFANKYKGLKHHSTLLKLTPGCCLMWHYDSYSAFVKFQEIPEEKYHKIRRVAIMLRDWNFGQTVQIGKNVISDWKIGDVFGWEGDVWHGAGNFGLSDLIVFQVTYLDD